MSENQSNRCTQNKKLKLNGVGNGGGKFTHLTMAKKCERFSLVLLNAD